MQEQDLKRSEGDFSFELINRRETGENIAVNNIRRKAGKLESGK